MNVVPYIAEHTLVIVALIIISGTICWILYAVYTNLNERQVYLTCDPGKCATNFYNGEKRCPNTTNETVFYDPRSEVCNSKYTCENPKTPYALLSNGATSDLGICEDKTLCRCLTKPQCAGDLTTVFNAVNDSSSALTESNITRVEYLQTSISSESDFGGIPLTYSNPSTQSCTITTNMIGRVVPRPPECNFGTNTPNLVDLYMCLEKSTYNLCNIGRAAFYPQPGETFNIQKRNTTRIGCVPNLRAGIDPTARCDNIYDGVNNIRAVSFWDSATNTIKCAGEDGRIYN